HPSLLRSFPTRRSSDLHFIRRNLGLILLSLVLAPLDRHLFQSWEQIPETGWWSIVAGPLKCEFWETLAIIGVTSIWVLPVIGARSEEHTSELQSPDHLV